MISIPANHFFIDHHAHTLRQDFLQIDTIGLRQPFSESRSVSQIQRHVPNSVSYIDCIDKLGKLLDCQGESSILSKRATIGKNEYVNLLFNDAAIGALIIDDGFMPTYGMPVSRFAQLCNRSVYRACRIETALERALVESTNFQELEKAFTNQLLAHDGVKTVCLKTIAAYRGGLEIDVVSRQSAIVDFERAKRARRQSANRTRFSLSLLLAGGSRIRAISQFAGASAHWPWRYKIKTFVKRILFSSAISWSLDDSPAQTLFSCIAIRMSKKHHKWFRSTVMPIWIFR